MYDQPRKETRGQKRREFPESMVQDALRHLREGSIPPTSIHEVTGFPSERLCRRAVSRYLFPDDKEFTWIQLCTYFNVMAMRESPEKARCVPTVLCGDCPFFCPDDSLTRLKDGRCIRYGKCSETGVRVERCSHCVYEKRTVDPKLSEKVGYHK